MTVNVPTPANTVSSETRSAPSRIAVAAIHRSAYMWPWEGEPRSIATGILDDETYDWIGVINGIHASHGAPVIAKEAEILRAHEMASELTSIDASATGTAPRRRSGRGSAAR